MPNNKDKPIDPNTDPYLNNISRPTHSEQLKQERNNILYSNLWLGLLGSSLCATILYFGLSLASDIQYLKQWYISVQLITLIRLIMIIIYKFHPKQIIYQTILHIFGVTLISLLWGALGSIMMPEKDPLSQMLIIIIITGLSAGVIQSLQASLISILIFISFTILPLCWWLSMQNAIAYKVVALCMTTYYIFSLIISVRGYLLLNQTLALKFFNYDLVQELSNSNITLRQTYLIQKHHEKDMTHIIKMNSRLQQCKTPEEAYDIIKLAGESIFKEINGSLSVCESKYSQMTVTEWGKSPRLQEHFLSNECWALRSGTQFDYKEHSNDIICKHYIAPPTGNTMCIPLTVQDDNIGMLNINIPAETILSKHLYQVVAVFADTIALALSNIKLQERLLNEATHDSLTNLVNRRYLIEALDRELISLARNKRTLCVAMLDIDFFKSFNDTAGHDAGDEVLKHIARILIHRTRGNDIACRFGGEEFILIFQDTTIEKVMPRLKQICEEIKTENIYYQNTLLKKITISVGLAESPSHGQTVEDIILSADKALYEAKNTGRDKIVIVNKLTPPPL